VWSWYAVLPTASHVEVNVVVLACQNAVSNDTAQADVISLMKGGYIQAEFMDFIAMGKSEGVFHTKFMVADGSGSCHKPLSPFPVP
jgi:hypothetical protein